MYMVRRTDDPEMDQELYTLGGMLYRYANNMNTENRRQSWMDGSDCDDEDQHRRSSVQKEAESQPRSVTILALV